VGSRWRLTGVADAGGTTEIPGSIDAWLELAADGGFIASDGCNAISGTFGNTQHRLRHH
jgi:heat shock protein HslJ